MNSRNILDRFWDKVDISGECWVWTAFKLPKGYGQFGNGNGKLILAHRFSYENFVGPIPEGLLVCHTCDNPPCVRPSHLWLGTVKDNYQDSVKKGRESHNIWTDEHYQKHIKNMVEYWTDELKEKRSNEHRQYWTEEHRQEASERAKNIPRKNGKFAKVRHETGGNNNQ